MAKDKTPLPPPPLQLLQTKGKKRPALAGTKKGERGRKKIRFEGGQTREFRAELEELANCEVTERIAQPKPSMVWIVSMSVSSNVLRSDCITDDVSLAVAGADIVQNGYYFKYMAPYTSIVGQIRIIKSFQMQQTEEDSPVEQSTDDDIYHR
ncbi:hypothetical protein VTN96DRAFT_2373 [Rasamsonia emersonii]